MSRLRISEALIFCSIRSLYAYLRHALCLGRCLPTTVAVAPQSWVMDIPAPLGLSLCDACLVLIGWWGGGRYRLGEIEVFGISFVLLLLQN